MTELKNPDTCEHRFVTQVDRWAGCGKYIAFKCLECDSELRPEWRRTDVLGHDLREEPTL